MLRLVTLLLYFTSAASSVPTDHFTFGPYEEGVTVVFQEVLDALPKLCDKQVNPMRNAFKTNAKKDEITYIGRRSDGGTFIFNEAAMEESGKVVIRPVNEEPPLLQVTKGYRLMANPIHQDGGTAFTVGNKPLVPILIYNCRFAQHDPEKKIFATVGSHDRNTKEIVFINEQCTEVRISDNAATTGYAFMELDIYESAAENFASKLSIFRNAAIFISLRFFMNL